MNTFKSFRELRNYLRAQKAEQRAARITARIQAQELDAWSWFERSHGFKKDAPTQLRRVHSHGRKGTFLTLRPAHVASAQVPA